MEKCGSVYPGFCQRFQRSMGLFQGELRTAGGKLHPEDPEKGQGDHRRRVCLDRLQQGQTHSHLPDVPRCKPDPETSQWPAYPSSHGEVSLPEKKEDHDPCTWSIDGSNSGIPVTRH